MIRTQRREALPNSAEDPPAGSYQSLRDIATCASFEGVPPGKCCASVSGFTSSAAPHPNWHPLPSTLIRLSVLVLTLLLSSCKA